MTLTTFSCLVIFYLSRKEIPFFSVVTVPVREKSANMKGLEWGANRITVYQADEMKGILCKFKFIVIIIHLTLSCHILSILMFLFLFTFKRTIHAMSNEKVAVVTFTFFSQIISASLHLLTMKRYQNHGSVLKVMPLHESTFWL